MNEEEKNFLEKEGFKVIERDRPDPHFRTRIFIQTPQGENLAYYDYLFQVPHLNDEDKFSINRKALKGKADQNRVLADLHKQNISQGNQLLTTLGIALFIVLSAILMMGTYFIIDALKSPPCGRAPHTKEVSQCIKIIILPDCSYRSIDTCADPDGDGDPEGEWIDDDWQKADLGIPWDWIIIGGVVIVGGFLLYKFWPQIKRKGREIANA